MADDRMVSTGLTSRQVEESRQKYGANIMTPPAKESMWRQFLNKFKDPLIIILMVAGVLSIVISLYEYFGLHHPLAVFFEPVGIFVAILLATGLAFYFENRADKEFAILNKVGDDEPVKVVRNGGVTTVARKDIVVGDIVMLSAGDEVPADGHLLESVTLSVDESSLTGEPLCHKTTDEAHFDKDATYGSDEVLRGTKVMEGHGIMRVDRVGDATEMGKVFTEAQIDNSVQTPLNIQLDRLGKSISAMSYSIAALVIAGRLMHYFGWAPLSFTVLVPLAVFFLVVVKCFPRWDKRACGLAIVIFCLAFVGWVVGLHFLLDPTGIISSLLSYSLQTLMVAVTLIVVSVPEGLPMAVTLSLAFSMRSLLKSNNLVRKLHACETMGATTVICTDKTGTLTQNRMQVAEADFFGNAEPERIAEAIVANSSATLDLSEDAPKVVGNPTEGALLLWVRKMLPEADLSSARAKAVAELPFSTERKFMATVVKSTLDGRLMLYVKGAPEIVLSMCSDISGDVSRTEIEQRLLGFQQRAMRTLGFAWCAVESAEGVIENGIINAPGLVFTGITAISDPVRGDVPAAVDECLNAGIEVKIVTGDTPATAREIGRSIGLLSDSDDADNVITGPEFAALSEDEVERRANSLKVIARARPADKKRLVEALQRLGHVVAVTGDGTNDAPALKAAHVGLSMGDGTSVAKEASDITIIDNSFTSIGRAVMWGRSLYRNIQRFLLFQLTVNVAACLLVLSGAFISMESPLTVTQMLWVNLIMDTFGAMALASLPPSRSVMREKPRDRREPIVTRQMVGNIAFVGVLFFVILFGFMYVFQHSDVRSMADLLHVHMGPSHEMSTYEGTLLFSIFVWTHFWYMFDARAFKTGRSAMHFKGCTGFGVITAVIVAGQVLIVEVLYKFFNVEPMRPDDWVIIVVGSSLVLWVRELCNLLKPRRSED